MQARRGCRRCARALLYECTDVYLAHCWLQLPSVRLCQHTIARNNVRARLMNLVCYILAQKHNPHTRTMSPARACLRGRRPRPGRRGSRSRGFLQLHCTDCTPSTRPRRVRSYECIIWNDRTRRPSTRDILKRTRSPPRDRRDGLHDVAASSSHRARR